MLISFMLIKEKKSVILCAKMNKLQYFAKYLAKYLQNHF